MDSMLGFIASLALATLLLVGLGVPIIKRLTLAMEGHFEFSGDSLTKRSRLAGFLYFTAWALVSVLAWSFFADWFFTGSLEYALTLLALKAEIVIRILAELGSD